MGLAAPDRGARRRMSRTGGQDSAPKPIANIEAEAALLGALMIDNRLIPDISERVAADDFLEDVHARVFRTIVRMHARGVEKIDPITLKPIFDNDPVMAELGGPAYLAQLTGNSAALIGARDFADQIAELAGRRRMLESVEIATEKLRSDFDASLDDVAGELEQAFANATERATVVKPATAADMVDIVIDRSERLKGGEAAIGATCRSISDLNKLFDVFEPGTMLLVAARPGMGKTALGLSAAWGFAVNGHPTEYYHAEMTREQLAMRLTSDISHGMGMPVKHRDIRSGKLTPTDLRILQDVKAKVSSLPLRTFPVHGATIQRLDAMIGKSRLRWERMGRKLEVVFVDYLQLLEAIDSRGRPIEKDTEKVNAISAGLRRIADRHKVCLIALSQLSREVEKRQDKRPQVSDLRDSGRLEQDADGVLLLFREEYYLTQSEPKVGDKAREAWEIDLEAARGKVDLILGKWRHGQGRTRQAKFYGENYAIRGGDFYPEDQQDLLL